MTEVSISATSGNIRSISRIVGWEASLTDMIETYRWLPFEWGKNDCFTFAVKCEHAICGKTRFPELYSAKYTNQFGSMRAFMREGYYGMIDCLHQRLDEIDMAVAKRGDWAAVGTTHGLAIGVVTGDKIAVTGEHGLVFLPYSSAVKSWRI